MAILKMKKLIIVLLVAFLLTGCHANYNLDINDNVVLEDFNALASKDEISSNDAVKRSIDIIYDGFLSNETSEESISYKYNKKSFIKIDNDSSYGFSYKDQYNIDDYYTSSPFLNRCYSDVDVETEDNKMSINTSSMFNCFDTYKWLDEVNINLKTKYYVLSNNADRVDGYTYTWVINRNNYRNKDISVNIDLSSKSQFTLNSEQSNKVFSTALIIIGVVVLVGGCFVGIKVFKSNR